jgi:hypothetical protein
MSSRPRCAPMRGGATGRLQPVQSRRHFHGHRHARGHCFAMQPVAVARRGLDRMSEGVAEIQDGAQTLLALVVSDHVRLDLAGAPDCVDHRRIVARDQALDVRFDPLQERRVADEAVLDDFRQACAVFARRQCLQRAGIGEDAARLVKRADHVLAARMIDTGLAADRRIHLRQ